MSGDFPYLHKFSKISEAKREETIISWANSWFFLYRLLYKASKVLVPLAFFTQVDENNENVSWEAIGYCGPDPDFMRKPSQTMEEAKEGKNQEKKDTEELFGPLYRGIISLDQPRKLVFERLMTSGFSVSMPVIKKTRLPGSPPPPDAGFTIKCDAVIVGSGSGGGVAAGVLANAGYKVVVLEKGSYFARNNLSLLEGASLDQMYLGNGLLATDNIDVILLAASTVGGGSTINWSASIQTPNHVIKEWSERYGLEMFESQLYKEAMDVVCKKMDVQSEIENEGFNNMVLRKGCQELGYPVTNIPRNASSDHYCGWCSLGCKDGRKKGTTETWLKDLVRSGNGFILPDCEAMKVLHKRENRAGGRGRAVAGVAFRYRNQGVEEICIAEAKVVIVACGAIGTPELLKRSGLKNPNIGKNLHIHPVAMAWGYFPDKPQNVWPEPQKKSYEGGIMTAMSTVAANFEGSGYGAVIQTPSLHPGMFSALMPWLSGADFKNRMLKFSRTAHVFALTRDQGSGEVFSSNFITYKMDKIDEDNTRIGLDKVLRILAAAGAEEIGTHHIKGKTLKVKQATPGEFEDFIRKESSRPLKNLSMPICSAHQMGSCRMGIDSKTSAVNPMGETWEMEGLYIADASVLPTALGVNPMVTVQAIAYCTAQSVLEVLMGRKRDI